MEWLIVASIPILIWASVFALGYLMSRKGVLRATPNVLAITGASLAYISFATGWSVVERGYDWASINDLSLFLLFTYPIAIITPLAGIGQAVVLVWVLGYRQETSGSIEPFFGYVIAWISVVLMLASMRWPAVYGRGESAPDIYDRLLTMTIRRRGRLWMTTERALSLMLAIVFLVMGATYLAFGRDFGAVVLLVIGLVFVLFMLSRHSHEDAREGGSGGQSAKSNGAVSEIRSGPGTHKAQMAWVVFLSASYIAALTAFWPIIGSFFTGYSGEERTRLLVEVLIVLAIVVPIAILSYRRATLPALPRELVVASVVVFSSFILIASLQLSSTIRMGLSVGECLLFAGIALVGPTLFYAQSRNGDKKKSGGPSSSSP